MNATTSGPAPAPISGEIMIRHCVFLRFRSDLPQAEKDGIWADLAALKTMISGFVALHIGPNVSPEGLGKGFAEGFIIDFDGPAARDAYLVHPDHVKLGGRIVAALEGGVEGVLVYDLEI
jgi:hypothetical protein